MLTKLLVNMSGDDLKSAEKRAADAAMEKENMRVAMTATEQKAISTTYVLIEMLQHQLQHDREETETPYLTLDSFASGCGMGSFLRLTKKVRLCSNTLTLFLPLKV